MSNRNRFADASLGVVFGVGIALLFLVWSVPEFRDPVHSQVSAQDGEHPHSKNNSQSNRTVYWDVLTLDDTLAQWVMGFFTIAATAVSLKAIFLVRDTLKANTEAVEQARAANSIAEEASEAQLRAYLHVVSLTLEHANDEYAPTITVKYKNFGQTPARNVVNHISISFVIIGNAKGRHRGDTNERGHDLGPGQDSSTSVHVSFEHGLVTREMLIKKLATLYVMGEITYKDVFGRESRYTRYKLRLHPDPDAVVDTDAFVICPDGNETN